MASSKPTCSSCSGSGCGSCGGTGASIAISRAMLKIAQQQADIATEKYNYYKSTTRPIEDELIQKAKTGQDAEYNAARAASNIGQGFQSTGRATNRYLQGIGIDQNDPRYAAAQKDLNLAEAAARAGAANTAREGTKEYNQNLRYAVAGFSLPAQAGAMKAIDQAGGAYGNAGTAANQGQALGLSAAASARSNATNQFMAGLDTRQFENTMDYNAKISQMKIQAAEDQAKASGLGALGSVLPMLGTIGGGILGTTLMPGLGTAGGAALGGAVGGAIAGGASGSGSSAVLGGLAGGGGGYLAAGGLTGTPTPAASGQTAFASLGGNPNLQSVMFPIQSGLQQNGPRTYSTR